MYSLLAALLMLFAVSDANAMYSKKGHYDLGNWTSTCGAFPDYGSYIADPTSSMAVVCGGSMDQVSHTAEYCQGGVCSSTPCESRGLAPEDAHTCSARFRIDLIVDNYEEPPIPGAWFYADYTQDDGNSPLFCANGEAVPDYSYCNNDGMLTCWDSSFVEELESCPPMQEFPSDSACDEEAAIDQLFCQAQNGFSLENILSFFLIITGLLLVYHGIKIVIRSIRGV